MRPPAQRPDNADKPVTLEWEEVERDDRPIKYDPDKEAIGALVGRRYSFWWLVGAFLLGVWATQGFPLEWSPNATQTRVITVCGGLFALATLGHLIFRTRRGRWATDGDVARFFPWLFGLLKNRSRGPR